MAIGDMSRREEQQIRATVLDLGLVAGNSFDSTSWPAINAKLRGARTNTSLTASQRQRAAKALNVLNKYSQ